MRTLSENEVNEILEKLSDTFPDAKCELVHKSPFELLVSTMLSAQCTDKRVNKVTERLFKKCDSPEEFLELSQPELEQEIKELGLYHSKSRNILAMCKELIMRFGGSVPSNIEDLMSLPGVGRKTANVVLSNAFGIPAIAVDTHVFRVANRIGLAKADNVEKTEEQLMECIPKNMWSKAHHLLIWHGRRICSARKPKCDICPIQQCCRYFMGINNRNDNGSST